MLTEADYRLMMSLVTAQQNFTVSDPSLPDNPIVFASQGFIELTGYSREQVLGRNCRFLQGPETDQKMVDVIRRGVASGEDTSVCLLNYKADGTPFWNQFFVVSPPSLPHANNSRARTRARACEAGPGRSKASLFFLFLCRRPSRTRPAPSSTTLACSAKCPVLQPFLQEQYLDLLRR